MHSPFQSSNGRLARRLSAYVILASTLITIFTSSIQIYYEYQRDINSVNSSLDQIEKTQLADLAARIWYVNEEELQNTLNNLLNIPSIKYVEIYENKSLYKTSGTDIDNELKVREYLLEYEVDNKILHIGKLVVKYSLSEVYQHIIDRAIIICSSNAIKTFIVAALIMIIFYRLVARHLIKISNFAEKLNLDDLDQNFSFDRKQNKENNYDELDLLKTALLNMKDRLGAATSRLQSREKILKTTLNIIGDAVIVTDTNGYVIRMNPRAEELTGHLFYDNDEQNITNIFTITDATTDAVITLNIPDIISQNESINHDDNVMLISKDLTKYHINNSISPLLDDERNALGVVVIFNDITEQLELRQEANILRRNMQSMMNHSTAVIYIKNKKGEFTFINRQFELLFHINHQDIIGKTLHDVFPEEVAHKMLQNDKIVVETKRAYESEEQAVHDDGIHTYISTKFPMFDNSGALYAVGGISTDITQLKHQEEKINRSQKMDSLGKLTGGIAHDYNNMLGVISGYSELLTSELNENPKLLNYVDKIRSSCERGANLTNKLLSFSRKNLINPSAVSLNTLIKEQQDILEKTMTVRITLNLDLDTNLWPVFLDKSEVEDTILNICINAMHAIKDKGQLTIRTRNAHNNEYDAKLTNIPPGDYVCISFTDTGCGMDSLTVEKIFDPFYSTKGEQGTGLGLSQVYGFVTKSRGSIKVYSKPGEGTQFILYFPRHYINNISEDPQPKITTTDYTGTESILLVDDEVDLLEFSAELLTQQGYTVFSAENGADALKIIEKENISLLLTDILMPGMDGYELASHVIKDHPHIKIQLASGFSDHRYANETHSELSEKILHKPFQSQNLLKYIRNLLDDIPTET